MTVRADSAYYNRDVVAAAAAAGRASRSPRGWTPRSRKAIAGIGEDAWTAIKYPNAIFDDAEQRWISDAEVAEIAYTAFTSRRKAEQVTARLIVRRVKRLNPASVPAGQSELFAAYRYHAVFTDSPLQCSRPRPFTAEHAIVEQVIADMKNGPLAHLPSGSLRRQRRLAGAGRDRVQPDPRRRSPGLDVPRQGHHRHDPRPADQHPGPDRPLRPPATPAPAPALAVGGRLDPPVHQHLRPTGHDHLLTTQPNTARGTTTWKSRTDRQTTHAHGTDTDLRPRSHHPRGPAGGSRLSRPAFGRPPP